MADVHGDTYVASLRNALGYLMQSDPRVYLIGEDLLDPYGGAFGVSRGLSTRFPARVVPTPISEACITGIGVGMALRGLRPIVEIMFGDFITLATDQLVNVASKVRQMYGEDVQVPLVVRTPMGGGRGYGPTHSQTLDRLFLGVPNLQVVAASHFHNPGKLLETAVEGDSGPVLFSENKSLYPRRLVRDGDGQLRVTALAGHQGYPTAVVTNFNSGRPDVGIVGYGGMSQPVSEAMKRLAGEEISVVAVFPASLHPLPVGDLRSALRGVGAVLVVEEGVQDFGWSAEVAARLDEALWESLKAPVARLGARSCVIPASRSLEKQVLPGAEAIESKLLELVKCTF